MKVVFYPNGKPVSKPRTRTGSEDDPMPTTQAPRARSRANEMTDRRIAEFALEESRLSNLAYRFELRAARARLEELGPHGVRAEPLPRRRPRRRLPEPRRARTRAPHGVARARGPRRHPLRRRGAGAGGHRAQPDGHVRDRQPPDALRRDHRAGPRPRSTARSPRSTPRFPGGRVAGKILSEELRVVSVRIR